MTDVPKRKLQCLDYIFHGHSLARARQLAGYTGSSEGYSWLFTEPVREVVKQRLAEGQCLPMKASLAYHAASGTISAQKVAMVKRVLRDTERLLISLLVA